MRIGASVGLARAFAAQAKQRARLRARRHAHVDHAVERRHFYDRAQRRLHDGDRHIARDHAAVALEQRMGTHAHDDVEIACGSATPSRLALSGNAARRTVLRVGGDGDVELALLLHGADAFAHLARLADDLAVAVAGGALLGQREEALLDLDLAFAATVGAGLEPGLTALGA